MNSWLPVYPPGSARLDTLEVQIATTCNSLEVEGSGTMTMNQDEAERRRRDLIEKRAYELFESRGGHHGFDREDWDEAEREIDGVSRGLAEGEDAPVPADDDERDEEPGV